MTTRPPTLWHPGDTGGPSTDHLPSIVGALHRPRLAALPRPPRDPGPAPRTVPSPVSSGLSAAPPPGQSSPCPCSAAPGTVNSQPGRSRGPTEPHPAFLLRKLAHDCHVPGRAWGSGRPGLAGQLSRGLMVFDQVGATLVLEKQSRWPPQDTFLRSQPATGPVEHFNLGSHRRLAAKGPTQPVTSRPRAPWSHVPWGVSWHVAGRAARCSGPSPADPTRRPRLSPVPPTPHHSAGRPRPAVLPAALREGWRRRLRRPRGPRPALLPVLALSLAPGPAVARTVPLHEGGGPWWQGPLQ